WMAKGASMPRLLSAITRDLGRPSSAKVFSAGAGCAIARSSSRSSSEAADTLGARDWAGLLEPRFGRRRAGAPPLRAGAGDAALRAGAEPLRAGADVEREGVPEE